MIEMGQLVTEKRQGDFGTVENTPGCAFQVFLGPEHRCFGLFSSIASENRVSPELGNDTAALFFEGILVFWDSLHKRILSRTFFNIVLYFFRAFRHLLSLQLHFFAKLLNLHLQLFLFRKILDVKGRHLCPRTGPRSHLCKAATGSS